MIKYCLEKWEANKGHLEEALRNKTGLNGCEYIDLVRLVVESVLNNGEKEYSNEIWDAEHITQIDDGDYQGTLLFLIPKACYQPCEYEYLMTYVGYGSCSGCDTLQHIQCGWVGDDVPEQQLKEYMALCKDMLTNMIKPYNGGWRNEEDFEEVKV